MAQPGVETFAPSGGRVTGVIGLVAIAGILVLVAIEGSDFPLEVVGALLVIGVLIWATMIKPRVFVVDGTLVMRNTMETIRVPLAAVEDLSVRQVLAVRTAQKRYVSPGVGRTVRQAIRHGGSGSTAEATKPALGPAFGGSAPSQIDPGMAYADFVELRLRDLVEEDRNRRGIRAYSPEAEALATSVRRDPAWLEIVALAATVLFLAVVIVL